MSERPESGGGNQRGREKPCPFELLIGMISAAIPLLPKDKRDEAVELIGFIRHLKDECMQRVVPRDQLQTAYAEILCGLDSTKLLRVCHEAMCLLAEP
jgi:hypothetical protein